MKAIDFNKEKFPEVIVKFNYITNDKDYDFFEEQWLELYKEKKDFYYIFDTSCISNVHLKYIAKLTSFIRFLKEAGCIVGFIIGFILVFF